MLSDAGGVSQPGVRAAGFGSCSRHGLHLLRPGHNWERGSWKIKPRRPLSAGPCVWERCRDDGHSRPWFRCCKTHWLCRDFSEHTGENLTQKINNESICVKTNDKIIIMIILTFLNVPLRVQSLFGSSSRRRRPLLYHSGETWINRAAKRWKTVQKRKMKHYITNL